MFEPIPEQARVPRLPKGIIIGFRWRINNSDNKIITLTNWINHVRNSRMSSLCAWPFWKSTFSWISWLSWSETKHNHPSLPRMTVTTELSEDGKLKLSVVHFYIRKAGKENNVAERSRWPVSYHCRSDDLCGLNLFIYSYICKKKKLSLVSGSYIIYDVYIIYTVHTATYTQHQGIKCITSSYRVFSYHDKSHSWPFLGTQV